MKLVYGDIIDELETGNYDAVAHGCNCMGTMGAGVAKVLNEYTGGLLLSKDRETILGDVNKLGSYSVLYGFASPIYNLYTQFASIQRQRGQNVVVHWASVEKALMAMIGDIQTNLCVSEANVLIPKIGCGLAGGHEEALFHVVDSVESCMWSGEITIISNEAVVL